MVIRHGNYCPQSICKNLIIRLFEFSSLLSNTEMVVIEYAVSKASKREKVPITFFENTTCCMNISRSDGKERWSH